jgi:hypothetical protein
MHRGRRVPRTCQFCGQEFQARLDTVKRGHGLYCSTSCASRISNRKHGRSSTRDRVRAGKLDPTYLSWCAMIKRCSDPHARDWPQSGGRGIDVCQRWRDDFRHFLADMGDRPDGQTLDRIEVNEDYQPANCRWASSRVQNLNRRSTIWLDIDGERIAAPDLERRHGFPRGTISGRLRHGWATERLLEPLNEPITRSRGQLV